MSRVRPDQLVKIELAVMIAFHFALLCAGFIAWVGFIAIGDRVLDPDGVKDPLFLKVITPQGVLLSAAAFALPGLFFMALGFALHRYVVVPGAAELSAEELAAGSPPSSPP